MALHADSRGEGAAATPLVLLHGFGARAAVWREVISRLPAALPVIAYDLPGHAASLGEQTGGAGRMAKTISADLDRRGLSRFHLCGHSLGGATAALIALRSEERIASLTLLAPGGFGPDIDARSLAAWRDAGDVASLRSALVPLCAEGFVYPARSLDDLAEARRMGGAQAALSAIYDTMFLPGEASHQGMLPVDDLARLASPVRLLWGTEDRILPVSQADHVPPNVTVHRLDGAGHMLIEERPEAVAAALLYAVAGD